jgi:NAD(P)-dependent dehydrogenase (short-subunit alcohol dehydrogenase family)
MSRRWLITGCSTGLGRAVAEAAAAAGHRVLATARRPETLGGLGARFAANVVIKKLDVRDPVDCASCVAAAVRAFGGVDVLVNNAAYGQLGAVEEIGDEELARQFETNVFGTWRLTRLVLPLMRAQGHGDVLMVSSAAGRMAFPGLGAYTATKYALEGLADTLSVELTGTGVDVTVLEPGAFATKWGESAVDSYRHLDAYRPVVEPMLNGVRGLADMATANPPLLFAETVMRYVDGEPRLARLPIGADGWQMALDAAEKARAELHDAAKIAGVLVGN